MIKFDQVSKRYPGSYETIKSISFEINQGDLVFVTGASGAGKSTLLKMIAGLERPTGGTVLIGNQNVSQLKPSAIPYLRRKFGLIFRDHKLLYDRNCFENVALPLYINGILGGSCKTYSSSLTIRWVY
jgi:cell division transport system ATP-binding protein